MDRMNLSSLILSFRTLSYSYIKKKDNFLYLFIIKALSKLRLEGNYFNLPKFTYEKLTVNIISTG